jgi:hypothetical protein
MGTRLLKPGHDIGGAEYRLVWKNLDISTTPAGNQSANSDAQPQTVRLEAGLAALLEFNGARRQPCRNM